MFFLRVLRGVFVILFNLTNLGLFNGLFFPFALLRPSYGGLIVAFRVVFLVISEKIFGLSNLWPTQ